MHGGYVKIYRDVLENPVVNKSNDYFRLWIFLLLSVSHKSYPVIFNGEKIELKAGQLITGRKSLSEKCGITESTVERILKSFENEQQIEQQKTNKNRLITIVNWDKYQNNEQQNEQQTNNKRTTNEQQTDNKRTTNEQQMDTNKNVKNIKNVKNVKYINNNNKRAGYEAVIDGYTQNETLKQAVFDFIDMRKAIKKPITDNGLKLIFKKLDKLADNDETKIEIVNQSTMNSWQGVFELRSDKGGAKSGSDWKNADEYKEIGWG